MLRELIGLSLVLIFLFNGAIFSVAAQSVDREKESKTSAAAVSVGAKSSGEQPKYALLVGITNYKSREINKIDGCENNVPALAETLVKDYGFEEKNVLSLLNEKATRQAILENFKTHLTDNAQKARADKKEAVVVYYFCGHGSQYPDQDDEENDGLDETFVAYDSRTADVFDILDDEIDDLKTELRNYTANTTLILESCHSGTGSKGDFRDEQYISQETDRDARSSRPPYKRKFPPSEREETAQTYTEIAASLSQNTAKSESAKFCECEKPMSLMTRALVQALKRAAPTTTYRELVREVAAEVSVRSRQEPQVEGNRDAFLFGGAARRARSYIEIESVPAGDQVTIRAGAIHGLKEGSRISFYASTSVENAGAAGWLANGVVVRVGNAASVVQLPSVKEVPSVGEIKLTSHAVLASPIFGGGPILLALPNQTSDAKTAPPKPNAAGETDAAGALRNEIEKFLNEDDLIKNGIVRLAANDKINAAERKNINGIIRLRRGKVADVFSPPNLKKTFPLSPLAPAAVCDGFDLKQNAPETRFPKSNADVFYLDDGEAGGAPLFGKTFAPDDKRAAEQIAATVKNYAFQRNLLALDNVASTLSKQIAYSFQYVPAEEMTQVCGQQTGREPASKPLAGKFKGLRAVTNETVPAGAFARLTIKNISGEIRRKIDEYASGESFHVAVIALTSGGEIKNIYGSRGANAAIIDGREIKINFQAGETSGVEKYVVVVSKDNFDFSFYESRGASRNVGFDLGRMLTRSGAKSKESGAIVKNEPDGWDVVHLELKIADCKDLPKGSKLCAE